MRTLGTFWSHEDLVEVQRSYKALKPVWIQVQEKLEGVSSSEGFFTRSKVLYCK